MIAMAVELSNNELAMAVLGVLGTLIGHHFLLRKYIRQQAGVKETTTAEISGNSGKPVKVAVRKEYVTKDDYKEDRDKSAGKIQEIEHRVREIELKMDADKQDIIDAGEMRANEIHRRINDLQREVASAPARTVALLKDAKGLL